MRKKPEPSFKNYVLAELRAAHIRARMLAKEIETIGVALRSNVIEPVTAIEWMAEAFMLRFIQTSDPPSLMTERTQMQIAWLRRLAEKGGKGSVDKIDARALGRIADELERLGMGVVDGNGVDVGENIRAPEARPADGANDAATPGGSGSRTAAARSG